METLDQRAALQRLIEEQRADYAGLSRLIGKNPAYIQQFIKRGTPRRLAEEDRRLLARYFGVDESVLGGPSSAGSGAAEAARLIPIPRLDVRASAGHGSDAGDESRISAMAFDERWLRDLCSGGTAGLSMIRVRGDSMAPALVDGDEILVDRNDGAERLRDGIYVLRRDEALMVKRLAVNPSSRAVAVNSDNEAYPSWPDCDPASIDVIGRVVWAGRKLA